MDLNYLECPNGHKWIAEEYRHNKSTKCPVCNTVSSLLVELLTRSDGVWVIEPSDFEIEK